MNFFSGIGHRFVDIGLSRALLASLTLFAGAGVALSQQTSADARGPAATNITASTLSAAQVDQIVRAFTSKETHFRQALNTYAFKRDALVQTIGMGGQVTGEYLIECLCSPSTIRGSALKKLISSRCRH